MVGHLNFLLYDHIFVGHMGWSHINIFILFHGKVNFYM